jgi:hypothetical protein
MSRNYYPEEENDHNSITWQLVKQITQVRASVINAYLVSEFGFGSKRQKSMHFDVIINSD